MLFPHSYRSEALEWHVEIYVLERAQQWLHMRSMYVGGGLSKGDHMLSELFEFKDQMCCWFAI